MRKCPGCEATVDVQRGVSIGEAEKATGWTAFFNQKNGLEAVYVCPECVLKVKVASSDLRRVFGSDLSYIHIGQVAKLSE